MGKDRGRRYNPTTKDFRIIAEEFLVKQWKEILDKTIDTLKQYPDEAEKAGVSDKTSYTVNSLMKEQINRIGKDLHLVI